MKLDDGDGERDGEGLLDGDGLRDGITMLETSGILLSESYEGPPALETVMMTARMTTALNILMILFYFSFWLLEDLEVD